MLKSISGHYRPDRNPVGPITVHINLSGILLLGQYICRNVQSHITEHPWKPKMVTEHHVLPYGL